MLVSILIGVLIFGYAGYTIYKHIQKSKMGKCASCELNKACSKQVCTVAEFKPEDSRTFTKPDAL